MRTTNPRVQLVVTSLSAAIATTACTSEPQYLSASAGVEYDPALQVGDPPPPPPSVSLTLR